jgi:hypothetical protein
MKPLIVLGDLSVIFEMIVLKLTPFDNKLAQIITQIDKQVISLNMVSYFHVIREFNYQTCLLANKASTPS